MSVIEAFVVIVFSAAGAMVQGCIGLGLALVSGPALVAVDADFAPGPLIVVGQIVGLRNVVVERIHTDRSAVRHCAIGLPFGLAAGLSVLAAMSDETIAILVGSVAAGGALIRLCGLRIPRSTPVEVTTGTAVAFTSVTAGLPGPMFALTFSDMEPPTMRGTIGSVFFLVAVSSVVGLVATGQFGGHELELVGWLIPGILLGLLIARFVRPRVDRTWFRPVVLVVAFIGGVALLFRQLL
ncbi:TSUP family transporter [Candidatus Poriferisocius sp.]|uniref:TSUP family transporter n=1 Tax=Candidatus Poriferisocius sp. TaxID=3101276 RepID=UPI003B5CAB3A